VRSPAILAPRPNSRLRRGFCRAALQRGWAGRGLYFFLARSEFGTCRAKARPYILSALAVLGAALALAAIPAPAQQGNQGLPASPGVAASSFFNVASYGATCDGSTDFTTQIQNAANAIPSTGGTLYFPKSAGVCIVSNSITIANPTTVMADGPASTGIKLANGANHHVFNVSSSNVAFYNLTINGNGSNQGSASYDGISFASGLSNLIVQNCVIENAAKDNIYMISDSHVLVAQSTLSGAGEDQFNYETTASVASSDIKFINNTVDSTALTTSFVAVYAVDAIGSGSTVTDVTVSGNTVHIPLTSANETDGIVVNGNTSGSVSRVTIEGNNIAATSGSGSTDSNGIEVAKGVDDFTVGHNTVSLMYQGILVQNCTASGCTASGAVDGNTLIAASGNQGVGLYLNDESRTLRVSATANTVIGWHNAVIVNSSNTTVSGNAIALTSADNYGIEVANASNVDVAGNYLTGTNTSDGNWGLFTSGSSVTDVSFRQNQVANVSYGFIWSATTHTRVIAAGNAFGTISSPYTLGTAGGVPAGVTVIDDNGALGAIGSQAVVNLTGQTAAKSSTLLYAVPANGQGHYEVCFDAKVTTAATTSSTLGGANNFQLIYTDADDSTSVTTPAAASFDSTSSALAGNTTGTQESGCLTVNAKASTNISYSFGYTSSGSTAMAYSLHARVAELLP